MGKITIDMIEAALEKTISELNAQEVKEDGYGEPIELFGLSICATPDGMTIEGNYNQLLESDKVSELALGKNHAEIKEKIMDTIKKACSEIDSIICELRDFDRKERKEKV